MAKTTMTQVIALATAIEVLGTMPEHAEVVEKLSAMKQTIENKRSTPSKADAAKQAEHENICSAILAVLTDTARMTTIKEMQSISPELAELSNQKISAMLRKLIEGGKVGKTIDKKVTYFHLI